MTKEELQVLYKELILPENGAPYHFEVMEGAAVELKAYNNMCGDKFHLHLDLSNDHFESVHFHGIGCAISKASTSILLKKIELLSAKEVKSLCEKFLDSLGKDLPYELQDRELDTLLQLKHFDGRVDCIKLSWEVLYDYLKTQKP